MSIVEVIRYLSYPLERTLTVLTNSRLRSELGVAVSRPTGVQRGVRWFFVLLLAGCRTGPSTDQFVAGGDVTALSVRIDAGNLRIREVEPGESAHDGAQADAGEKRAVTVVRSQSGAVESRRRVVHGVLEIEANCAAFLPCTADLEIEVPRGMAVDVELGDGVVELESLTGDVRVDLGSGQLRGWDLGTATLRAQVGWGDSDLDLRVAPSEMVVNTGGGDIRVTVPSGAYNLDLRALGGEQLSGVTHDGRGGRIALGTSSGQVLISGI